MDYTNIPLEREDAGIRAIVPTGAGRAFSAGGDVKEMARTISARIG